MLENELNLRHKKAPRHHREASELSKRGNSENMSEILAAPEKFHQLSQ
jgi:hypothetical protein